MSLAIHDLVRMRLPATSRGSAKYLVLSAFLGLIVAAGSAVATSPTPCVIPDNGSGTGDLPPGPCAYVSLTPLHIIDGLPAPDTIDIDASIDSFFDIYYLVGGPLGGEVETYKSILHMELQGTGSLAGFHRILLLPAVQCETDAAPRVPYTPIQSFNTDYYGLQGQLPPGDPDFDLLRITAGTGFGLPSPGHTTLTQTGPNWSVDSFFDITYRIDFVGHPGGPLSGRSGSTTATVRIQAGTSSPTPAQRASWGALKTLYR